MDEVSVQSQSEVGRISRPEIRDRGPARRARLGWLPPPRVLGTEPTPQGVLQREGLYRRLLALADLAAASLALLVAFRLIAGHEVQPAMLLALPAVILVSKIVGLYDRDELVVRKTTLDEAPALFQLATVYTLLIWLAEDQLVSGSVGRRDIVVLWGTLFVAFIAARALARVLARRFAPAERCAVIGDRSALNRVKNKLRSENTTKAAVVAHIDLHPNGRRHDDPPAEAERADLPALVSAHDVHRVIVAPGSVDSQELLDLVGSLKALGVRVSVLPRLFEVVGSSVEFDRLGGLTLLGVRRFGLTRSSSAIKRLFDVVASAVILFLLAPLMALISLIIKLDSRGPVLFHQTRIGQNGRPFQMIKFRTMVQGADARKPRLAGLNETEGLFKIADDPRVTRVGRFLRRAALDELPQLWNVLRGDMSIVGPRPLVVDEDERIEGWHRGRIQLMPGMTGHWQVLGAGRIPLEEMMTIDYLYIANWSLWADFKIICRTVPYVLGRRGL
jgi:exopolysaccharide biosynthesis polyprenyl glycosylphosphotransferase